MRCAVRLRVGAGVRRSAAGGRGGERGGRGRIGLWSWRWGRAPVAGCRGAPPAAPAPRGQGTEGKQPLWSCRRGVVPRRGRLSAGGRFAPAGAPWVFHNTFAR